MLRLGDLNMDEKWSWTSNQMIAIYIALGVVIVGVACVADPAKDRPHTHGHGEGSCARTRTSTTGS